MNRVIAQSHQGEFNFTDTVDHEELRALRNRLPAMTARAAIEATFGMGYLTTRQRDDLLETEAADFLGDCIDRVIGNEFRTVREAIDERSRVLRMKIEGAMRYLAQRWKA